MSPPQVPGVPGLRLPEPWEKRCADLEARIVELEKRLNATRERLDTIDDFEEDSQVKIPTDAPPRVKVILGFASGLTPTGRLIIGLAIIGALVALALRGLLKF